MLRKSFFTIIIFITLTCTTQALVINEIMSNPIGDDGGREWVELYNETADPIDVAGLTISKKVEHQVLLLLYQEVQLFLH